MNLMTDTFIDRVDLFGKYQEALFLFTIARADSLDMVMSSSHEWMGIGMKMRPH